MEKLQRGHNLCRIKLCPLNIEPAAKGNIFDKLITKTEIWLNMFCLESCPKEKVLLKYEL
jgi:hypothetical protein